MNNITERHRVAKREGVIRGMLYGMLCEVLMLQVSVSPFSNGPLN